MEWLHSHGRFTVLLSIHHSNHHLGGYCRPHQRSENITRLLAQTRHPSSTRDTRMSIFRSEIKATYDIYIHDKLCPKNPCVCVELTELRQSDLEIERRLAKHLRIDLARHLLDGEK